MACALRRCQAPGPSPEPNIGTAGNPGNICPDIIERSRASRTTRADRLADQDIILGDAAVSSGIADIDGTTGAARAIVTLSSALNTLGGAGIVFLALATVYDVFARYLFNQPTIWATEISTYVLIAATFFGAAHTHLIDGHVRVDVLLHRLTGSARRTALLTAAWLALLFVFITAWQSVLMVLGS